MVGGYYVNEKKQAVLFIIDIVQYMYGVGADDEFYAESGRVVGKYQ